MTRLEPFSLPDLTRLRVQERHAPAIGLALAYTLALQPHVTGPWSWTARADDGRTLACCGILEANDRAWAFLAADAGAALVGVTRRVQQVLAAYSAATGRRPLADIDETHREAVRWATILGFRRVEPGLWEYHA